jgi:diguanylate cyclase (GGDEF)-like protein/PAS domain S-box-containing protein
MDVGDTARFPEENPNPVLRLARKGEVLYANPAGRALLEHFRAAVGDPAPAPLREGLSRACRDEARVGLELPAGERVYQFDLSPVPDQGYANAYGYDVTERLRAREALQRAEERYRLAQQAAGIGSWDWNVRSGELHLTETVEPMFGMEPGGFEGTYRAFLRLVHPEDKPRLRRAVREAMEGGAGFELEHRLVWPSGEVRWLLQQGSVLRDSSGLPRRMLGIVQDVTARRQDREQVRILSRAVEQSPVSVCITDLDGTILYVNPKFLEVSGYEEREVLGKTPRILKSDHHPPEFYAELWNTVAAGHEWRGEMCNISKNGREFWESVSISSVTDEQGASRYYVAVKEEITDKKEQEARMRHLAMHDALTGLPNRLLFVDRLRQALAHAERTGGAVALLFLDLDGFKPVNDRLGHQAGDDVLVETARRLERSLRRMDTAARLGGDEFACILQEFENSDQVGTVARRILTAINEPVRANGQECRVGASIGVALYPQDARTLDGLLYCADEAMYMVKRSGRNAVRFHETGEGGSCDEAVPA